MFLLYTTRPSPGSVVVSELGYGRVSVVRSPYKYIPGPRDRHLRILVCLFYPTLLSLTTEVILDRGSPTDEKSSVFSIMCSINEKDRVSSLIMNFQRLYV